MDLLIELGGYKYGNDFIIKVFNHNGWAIGSQFRVFLIGVIDIYNVSKVYLGITLLQLVESISRILLVVIFPPK